jgi:hypothetical protein
MADTARAYFDAVFSMAGGSGRRVRDMAGRVREDLGAGADRLRSGLRSGAEQLRSQGSRTATDVGRLIRAEVDAGLVRAGVATQSDLDDLNLRLEYYEEEIRELRLRLAEAETAAARPAAPADDPDGDERA